MGLRTFTPALLTRKWMRWNVCKVLVSAASIEGSSVTSRSTTRARRPWSRTWAAVISAALRWLGRSATTMSAPAAARPMAMDWPMPFAAPVTNPTWPSSLKTVSRASMFRAFSFERIAEWRATPCHQFASGPYYYAHHHEVDHPATALS